MEEKHRPMDVESETLECSLFWLSYFYSLFTSEEKWLPFVRKANICILANKLYELVKGTQTFHTRLLPAWVSPSGPGFPVSTRQSRYLGPLGKRQIHINDGWCTNVTVSRLASPNQYHPQTLCILSVPLLCVTFLSSPGLVRRCSNWRTR